ncbi:MAG TPA: D-2-hydroxyacid dehydrogenase family protein [Micropepsaceae bacterium]|nr:D-2-hydroxyacid dehydrogenase family protein [Micropepsaceae bacterium]
MAGIRVAVTDDWQKAAADVTDWSALRARAEVVFFPRHYAAADEDQAVQDLKDFDIILPTRERSRFSESLIARLPKLKMMSLTGSRAPNVDQDACTKQGIICTFTSGGHSPAPAAEMTLALLLAAARKIPQGDAAMRAGRFQEGIPPGINLEGRTLGLVGLGRIGAYMARYGHALGMRVIGWSQNLTDEKAKEAGAERVDRETLFAESDAVSIHLVLGPRSRGLIVAADFARMKKGAIFINTSRGPIVDEAALVAALREGRIVAGLDVYDREPLPPDNPFRSLPNTVLTPHLGFTTVEGLGVFYEHAIHNILAFLDGKPVNVANPDALKHS